MAYLLLILKHCKEYKNGGRTGNCSGEVGEGGEWISFDVAVRAGNPGHLLGPGQLSFSLVRVSKGFRKKDQLLLVIGGEVD
jgi:hypothetical protein